MQSTHHAATEETLRPLNDVVREVIPGSRNPSTSWRWITRGISGTDGERIRLQVWYVGRQPHTTETAVRDFIAAVTAARLARLQQRHQHAADVSDTDVPSKQRHKERNATMKAYETNGIICVRDVDGISLWTPSEEAQAEIHAAADPKAKAVEICRNQPMRGKWAN